MQSGIWTSVESPQSWPQAQFNAPSVSFNRAPSVSAPPTASVISPSKETSTSNTTPSGWTQSWETTNVFKKAGAKLFGKSKSSKSSEVKAGEVAVAESSESTRKKVSVSAPPVPQIPEEPATEEDEHIEDELSRQNLYKTELCRSFQETGICRYGHKCQFAHGYTELRPVMRHPKYKTEICKTFTNTGNCPYGNRCRFIHQANPQKVAPEAPTASTPSNGWSTSWTQAQEAQKPAKKPIVNHTNVDDLLDGTRRLAVFQQLAN